MNQNPLSESQGERETVVDECDAGLMKFPVPIFVADEFLGTAGGCGLLRNEEQVDTYLVHRTTDLAEKVVEDLSENIATIPNDRLESAISYLEKKVAEIIIGFKP